VLAPAINEGGYPCYLFHTAAPEREFVRYLSALAADYHDRFGFILMVEVDEFDDRPICMLKG
jgi:hypothetical protein